MRVSSLPTSERTKRHSGSAQPLPAARLSGTANSEYAFGAQLRRTKACHLRTKMGMNTAGKSPRYFHLPMRNTC
jgi:hypothetical protein